MNTLKKAEKLVKKWQEILKLQPWQIRVTYEGPDKEDHIYASTSFSMSLRQANIKLHRDESDEYSSPLELTIVHELVHLHCEVPGVAWEKGSSNHMLHEAGIETIAAALMELEGKRNGRG